MANYGFYKKELQKTKFSAKILYDRGLLFKQTFNFVITTKIIENDKKMFLASSKQDIKNLFCPLNPTFPLKSAPFVI